MPANAFTIGVDLGGTNLRIGAYALQDGLLQTIHLPTRLKNGREAVARDICTAIRQLIAEYTPSLTLAGVGIGSPGPLELPAGILRQPPNLPGWNGFNLRHELESALEMPVALQNDANAAALAECQLGRGKTLGVDSLCMLTLGTGVGGGIVLHGKIWEGITGMAGEVGHLNIWTEGGKPAFDARDVAELATAGDPEATAILHKVGRSLGIGLASLVNTLNLPLYVLGGGLANAWDLFAPGLFDELRKRSYIYRLTSDKTHITTAELGVDAGVLGACLLPLHPAE